MMRRRLLRIRAGQLDILTELLRATSPCRYSARCSRMPRPEQGARMSAMDNATRMRRDDQAADIDLQRTRQAMITKELIEIISGAERYEAPRRCVKKKLKKKNN